MQLKSRDCYRQFDNRKGPVRATKGHKGNRGPCNRNRAPCNCTKPLLIAPACRFSYDLNCRGSHGSSKKGPIYRDWPDLICNCHWVLRVREVQGCWGDRCECSFWSWFWGPPTFCPLHLLGQSLRITGETMRLFCFQLKASCLEWSFFCLQLSLGVVFLTVGAFKLTIEAFLLTVARCF